MSDSIDRRLAAIDATLARIEKAVLSPEAIIKRRVELLARDGMTRAQALVAAYAAEPEAYAALRARGK